MMREFSPFLKCQIRSSSLGIVYQNPHDRLRMNVTSGGNVAERLLTAGWREGTTIVSILHDQALMESIADLIYPLGEARPVEI
jgi:ABC-type phosphonate transport system ATPase subunit